MITDNQCPLCFKSARIPVPTKRTLDVECGRCGHYRITSTLAESSPRHNDLFLYLRAATRQSHEAGQVLLLTTANWQDLAQRHRATAVGDKSTKLLRYFGRLARTPEALFGIDADREHPVLDAISSQEFDYFLGDLCKRGLIKDTFETDAGESAGLGQITRMGWDELQPSGGVFGRCFVAMAFDPDLDAVYSDGIKRAIVNCGYQPICLKEIGTNDDVCDLILSEIRKSQFIVADFTRQKAGVYFEAGFAKALEARKCSGHAIPMILTDFILTRTITDISNGVSRRTCETSWQTASWRRSDPGRSPSWYTTVLASNEAFAFSRSKTGVGR
jgi:hypothetical protein